VIRVRILTAPMVVAFLLEPKEDTLTMRQSAALGQVSLLGRDDLRTHRPGTRVPKARRPAP